MTNIYNVTIGKIETNEKKDIIVTDCDSMLDLLNKISSDSFVCDLSPKSWYICNLSICEGIDNDYKDKKITDIIIQNNSTNIYYFSVDAYDDKIIIEIYDDYTYICKSNICNLSKSVFKLTSNNYFVISDIFNMMKNNDFYKISIIPLLVNNRSINFCHTPLEDTTTGIINNAITIIDNNITLKNNIQVLNGRVEVLEQI